MSSKEKSKRYANAVDLARDILDDDDPQFADDLQRQIENRKLVNLLGTMRNQKGVTQSDIADVLGCKQAKISKLENGLDDAICIEEIRAYAKAVDCEVTLQFTNRNETALDRIKRLSFTIHRELSHLASLAQQDEKIAKGVAEAFSETLINQMRLLEIAAKQLPVNPVTNEPYIKVSMEVGREQFATSHPDETDNSLAQTSQREVDSVNT